MGESVLISLGLIIGISALLAILAKVIRQPPIIAYLVAGILIGPLFLNILGGNSASELVTSFAHIGVAFLLFIVGLNLDFRVLKEIGSVSVFAGFFEIIITAVAGFFIALGLGLESQSALYLGAALAFSSTVVVVKILSDKKEIDTLHGKIALGILIVEDFVAAVVLMVIPFLGNEFDLLFIFKKIGIIILLIGVIILISIFFIKRLLNYLAKNQEVLFLFGVAWALCLAALFDFLGFSLEIGALIAGMSLASTKYTMDLGGKIKPLRDFFVVMFFVFFGSQLSGTITWHLIQTALIISAFVFLGKPLIVMTILRIFDYKKKTNFLTGASIAQISEFSLILVLLGFNLGHISQEIMSLAVLIAVFTIGASSYSIYYSHAIFNKISHLLNIFEGKRFRKEEISAETYEVVLFGHHRMGQKLLNSIKKLGKTYAVIDYNPKEVLSLGEKGMNTIYGDASDKNFLSELPLDKAKLIISTIPEKEANIAISDRLKEIGSEATFIATAEQPNTALDLYKENVDYVIVPHYLGGDYMAHLIEKHGLGKSFYEKRGEDHKKELSEK